MLETIRELAGERLTAGGEEPRIRGAHARWWDYQPRWRFGPCPGELHRRVL
jgi:hypothetical protein